MTGFSSLANAIPRGQIQVIGERAVDSISVPRGSGSSAWDFVQATCFSSISLLWLGLFGVLSPAAIFWLYSFWY